MLGSAVEAQPSLHLVPAPQQQGNRAAGGAPHSPVQLVTLGDGPQGQAARTALYLFERDSRWSCSAPADRSTRAAAVSSQPAHAVAPPAAAVAPANCPAAPPDKRPASNSIMREDDVKKAKNVKAAATVTMNGTDGDDFLYATDAATVMHGGYGEDTLLGGNAADKLYGDANDDTLLGGGGDDTLDGGTGKDTLDGGAGKDKVYGGAGDDTFLVSSAAEVKGDVLNGGSGVDSVFVSFSETSTGISFTAADPSKTVKFGGLFDVTGVEKWMIYGGSGVDKLTGWSLDDVLSGGKGDDVLKGMAGDDFLTGGEGKDQLFGGSNDDYLSGEVGDDTISGDLGNDFATGGAGNDTITGGDGIDRLEGSAGADKIDGGSGDDWLYSNGFASDDTTAEKDDVQGGDGTDYVSIGMGDTANGGSGTDRVHLEFSASKAAEDFTFSGSKIVLASGGSIRSFESLEFHGGSGKDKVTGGSLDDQLDGGKGDDTMHGAKGDDTLLDSAGADKLYGDAGNDSFEMNFGGAAEKDTVDGGDGFDSVFFGEDALQSVYLDLGDQSKNAAGIKGDSYANIESYTGTQNDDFLYGSSGKDMFFGGESDDVLDGRKGDDWLSGGEGSDTLTGGTGKDVFDYTDFGFPQSWQGDEITDFKSGEDKMHVSLEAFGFTGANDFRLVSSGNPSAGDTHSTLLFNQSTHQLWWDQDGKGAGYDPVLIATLDNVAKLQVSDFSF